MSGTRPISPEIYVEVVSPQTLDGGQDLGPRNPEHLRDRIAEVTRAISGIAQTFASNFDEALSDDKSPWVADELQVSFGVNLQAESNLLVVRASSEATFVASVKWSRKD